MLLSMAETANRRVNRPRQEGFTLIEVMVVVAIFAVLVGIGIGSWGETRTRSQVESVIEEIRSVMGAARLRARATGEEQSVVFNYTDETVADSATGDVRAYGDMVDITAFACGSCNTSGVASNTFNFTPRGTVGAASIRVQSRDGTVTRYVVVSATGRLRVAETCASGSCS